MTGAEIEQNWLDFMHRQSLTSSVADVREYATGHLLGMMQNRRSTIDDVIRLQPAAYLQAGLAYLNQLARDDEAQDIALGLTGQRMADFNLQWSRENVTPRVGYPNQWSA